jgi:methionine aminopeptidase
VQGPQDVQGLQDVQDVLFLWKVKIGARICPSAAFFKKQIRRNEISNIGFAFHVKHKDKAYWPDIRGGDFKCIDALSQHLKCIWIDDVLTCTNSNAGNFGNQRDIALNNDDTRSYVSFCNKYTEVMGKMIDYVEPEKEIAVPTASTVHNNDEKVYVLKESTIKAIAEMLSSAIQSKQLYEDIINQSYLTNKSIIKEQHKEQTTPTKAKDILQQLEKDEEMRASMLMKKSELLVVHSNVDTENQNIVLLTQGNV